MAEKSSSPLLPLPAKFLAEGENLATATVIAFTEGPAVDADGSVYFSDIWNSRIMKLSPDGSQSVFRAESGRTNGNTFDPLGRLLSCEGAEMGPGGRRRVVRTDLKTGEVRVLTERYEGIRYNSPNDIVVDGRGRIYFTDPCYGDRSLMEMEIEGVYRIDLDGSVTRILQQPDIQRPNGIAITPDDRTLYLVDSNPNVGGNRKIWAFDLADKRQPFRISAWFMILPQAEAATACGSTWREISGSRLASIGLGVKERRPIIRQGSM